MSSTVDPAATPARSFVPNDRAAPAEPSADWVRAVVIEGARRGDMIAVAANAPSASLDVVEDDKREEAQLLALLDRIVASAQSMEQNAHAARFAAETNLDGLKRVRDVAGKLNGYLLTRHWTA